jgi:hypothetical protein
LLCWTLPFSKVIALYGGRVTAAKPFGRWCPYITAPIGQGAVAEAWGVCDIRIRSAP